MTALTLFIWLFPIPQALLLVSGLTSARWHGRYRIGSGATEAIIQITTIGNHDTVNSIIRRIREYQLPFKYQIWVVVEPFSEPGFVGMDDLIVVPAEFPALAKYKARAQEYSRTIRGARGLGRKDVKVVMLDDDVLPTRKYLVDVFNADYDVCEGVITPRLHYGRFLSHLDDLRTLSCLTICSVFQGFGHPCWVHGEGLCVRGDAEQVVTWNYPIVASEDLVFGQNAVERGMSWGFVWEYVQITSPWTMRDFIKQRRRWLWGNINAIKRGLIPPLGTVLVLGRRAYGIFASVFAAVATILVPLRLVYIPTDWYAPLFASLAIWVAQFAIACWIGSSLEGRSMGVRARDAIVGVVLSPVTSLMTFVVIVICLIEGDPKKFEVIAKVRPGRPPTGDGAEELVPG
jgi:Glycosyl transferase family group 2